MSNNLFFAFVYKHLGFVAAGLGSAYILVSKALSASRRLSAEQKKIYDFLKQTNWKSEGYYFRENYHIEIKYKWVFFSPQNQILFRDKDNFGPLGKFLKESVSEWVQEESKAYAERKDNFLSQIQ